VQLPGLGIEQLEIFEMVDVHGLILDRPRLDWNVLCWFAAVNGQAAC